MSLDSLALIALVLAAIPCGLFLLNLFVYIPLPRVRRREAAHPDILRGQPESLHPGSGAVSVLIPARNEEHNIGASLAAVLASRGMNFEVVVLDDHSTDRTAEIVSAIAARDPRVRLEPAPSLPAGWCGKQHACHVLARHARHPLLVFIDADVRLAPDALARMGRIFDLRLTMDDLKGPTFIFRKASVLNPVALASGVPRQELGTFSERLLLPLIHFILLGCLPMVLMRRTRLPGFSAGCGQLFIARRDAYFAAGGHAAIQSTLHDGVKLPRTFRRAGFATDLFDATDVATCRMYHTNAETWRGLGKNATEGLAAPGTILPMTVLLLGGQVLPYGLLACAPLLTPAGVAFAAAAAVMTFLPRLLAVACFHQPLRSAFLHPLGVLGLLAIQWHALLRQGAGRPAQWKGRSYGSAAVAVSTKSRMKPFRVMPIFFLVFGCLCAAGDPPRPPARSPAVIELRDQYDAPQHLVFPATNVIVLTIADRKGSGQIDGWVAAIKGRYAARIELRGLADLGGVPGLWRGKVQRKFQETRKHPVMMDWSGKICAHFQPSAGEANVLVLDREGNILGRAAGPATAASLATIQSALDRALAQPAR